jgi:hypothetical protein
MGKLWSDGVLYAALVIGFATASWWFRSTTDYGDGVFTPMIIAGGHLMNWKEPLDRLITALTYRGLDRWLGWDPRSAIALVSCAAGVVYSCACILVARTLATDQRDRLSAVLLLLVLGAAQLFFGNVENYSLLAAGTMIFLYAGLRHLRGFGGIVWPSLALGITASIHLSAAWLLPTLPLLSSSRRALEGGRRLLVVLRVVRDGVVSATTVGMLLGGTFLLGLLLAPEHETLSFEAFGGGDEQLWVPLWEMTTSNHKFTTFSGSHLLAIANEVLLLCPIGLFLVLSHLPFVRRLSTDALFLGTSALLYFLYLLVFNPDLAIFNVGILNEWDLFSPLAFPLTTLGVALWLDRAVDSSARFHIALVGIAFGGVHAASWILSNAGMTF